jgi:DNA-binding FadR family transcriptional regulator
LRIRAVLAELTGEPVIKLFIECLNDLTIEFASVQPSEREWREDAENYVKAVQRVLTAGEPLAAMAATEKLNDDLDAWLRQDDGQLPLPSIEIARQADDRTLATFVARKIAVEVLRNRSAGRRLGSEWDLCERFSVGRLTLRQAIRQLQDSGLVECRRGRGNGLVVRDLRGTGSIRLVLAFLISRQMDPTEAGAILFQLNRFVPALAVSRANNDQRAKLEKLVSQAQQSDPIDRYDLLRLVQYVSQLADSPIIDLFSRCLAAYEARFHPLLAERLPASVQAEYFDLLRRLLNEMDPADQSKIEWAKHESSKVMLTMSRTRPL